MVFENKKYYRLKNSKKILEFPKNLNIDFGDLYFKETDDYFYTRDLDNEVFEITYCIKECFVRIKDKYFFFKKIKICVEEYEVSIELYNKPLIEQTYDKKVFLPFINNKTNYVTLYLNLKKKILDLNEIDIFKIVCGEDLKKYDVEIFGKILCEPLRKFVFNKNEFDGIHKNIFDLENLEDAFEEINDEKIIKNYKIEKGFN